MERIKKHLRLVIVALAIFCGVFILTGNTALADAERHDNIDDHNYIYYWSSPTRSYVTNTSDGGFMIFDAGAYNSGDGYRVEYYDGNYKFLSSKTVATELPLFGAFYSDGSNYYVLTGKENDAESATAEVYRVTKYDTNWKKIKSVSLKDCNTTLPFRAGSADMVASNGKLFIKTSHQMYTSSDGLRHQANLTMLIDTAKMKMLDSQSSVYNYSVGYCSHSFNQFVALDGNNAITADHGDAYPRGILFCRYNNAITKGNVDDVDPFRSFSFTGNIGQNYTGATLGGLAVSASSYMAAGSSVDQNNFDSSRTRNIYVVTVNKSTGDTDVKWLTSYAEGTESAGNPYLIKMTDNKFMVLWSRGGVTNYAVVDGEGNLKGKIRTLKANLSDCKPVYNGGKLIWYTCEDSQIQFNEVIDCYPEVSVKKVDAGVQITWDKLEIAAKYRIFKKNEEGKWVKLATTTSLKYTDKNVLPGDPNTYTVMVMDKNGKLLGEYGDGVSIKITLDPVEISLENKAAGINVSWEAVSNAAKYQLFRKVPGGSWEKLGTTTSLKYSDKKAVFSETYLYSVRAMTKKGNYINKYGNGTRITRIVSAPKLTLANVEDGVEISWKAMTGAAKYNVYVKNASGKWKKLKTVRELSYIDTATVNGVDYTYSVIGLDASGHFMNENGDGYKITRNDAFVKPDAISTTDGVVVSWEAFEGAAKYRIFRKNASGKWVKLGVVTQLEYLDPFAAINEENTYAVVAYASDNTKLSDYGKGKTMMFIIPATPVEAIIQNASVRLEWSGIISAEKYQVYRRTKSTDWAKIGTTKELYYKDKTVESGKNYYYSIIAIDGNGKALNDYGEGILVKYRAAKVDALAEFLTEEIEGAGIAEETEEVIEEENSEEKEDGEEENSEEKEDGEEETSEEKEDGEEETSEEKEDGEEDTSEEKEDGEEETSEEKEDGEESSEGEQSEDGAEEVQDSEIASETAVDETASGETSGITEEVIESAGNNSTEDEIHS